jgi:hypothetical protein
VGEKLNGKVLPGGADWQIVRSDGVVHLTARYTIETDSGGLILVNAEGYRHGPPEVMARLARGEAVPREAYFFRTVVRFTTGAPAWAHLNKVLALACGEREARLVKLDLYRIT